MSPSFGFLSLSFPSHHSTRNSIYYFMPYARRHQLTPRQRQILGTLQRTSVPTSVAVQVVNNNPHSRPGVTSTPPLGTPFTKRDASIDTTTRSNEYTQAFESRVAVTGAGETPGEGRLRKEGDRVTTLSRELVSNGAQQAESDDSNKIMPRDVGQREQTSARPCSKRESRLSPQRSRQSSCLSTSLY